MRELDCGELCDLAKSLREEEEGEATRTERCVFTRLSLSATCCWVLPRGLTVKMTTMNNTDDTLTQRLLETYVYQKVRLLEEAGHEGRLDKERLAALSRPRMEKMAALVADWNIKPDVLMEAAFAWAKFNQHPDGPMPNMLLSEKYLTKALSHYLQVPYEVAQDRKCVGLFLQRMDFDFTRTRQELERAGVTDLSTATSFPIEIRYLMAVGRGDMEAAFYMSQELLERMSSDRRVALWLDHRGVRYERVAEYFNRKKKTQKP